MEDTIEICSGCGKMPRAIDKMEGYFICSRCGCRSTVMVSADDYERTAMDLDQKFHEKMIQTKTAEVKKVEGPKLQKKFKNPVKKLVKKAKKAVKKTKKKVKKAVKKVKKKVSKKKTVKKKTTKKKPAKKKKKR